MKILVVVSSLDLTQPFSATPAWWMLLKGLYETGVEVLATPYQGPAIESLWWQALDNPAKWQGDFFKTARDTVQKVLPERPVQMSDNDDSNTESLSDTVTRRTAQTLIAPLWHNHLDNILTQQPDIDAVLVLTVPLNHLNGVPRDLSQKHNIPFFYFDGDVPASLPNMKGFASGFRIYQGADVSDYTAFISNSKGGEALLKELGVENTHTVFYAADPDVYAPLDIDSQDIDCFFYGHGREYRAEWIESMITLPSKNMPETQFRVRGTKLGDIGQAQQLPYLSFSKLREYVCRSKLNLCITRGAHASVYASSSMRPFELASMGACIVANPYDGLETWFEPEREILIVDSAEEAQERYTYLLSHDTERQKIGRAARERVLKEHTFRHRARELRQIIASYL
ncbi:MAG: CgeB family protein [Aggregatilineales bacterium]